jgi:type IV pilus assembly protein PilW
VLSRFIKVDNRCRQHKRSEGGFGLVEIMISILLSSILIMGLIELFASSSKNAQAAAGLSRIQESGRTTLHLLTSDIRRTGYLGGMAADANISGSLDASAMANTCVADTTDWARMVDQPLFGLNDSNAGYACVSATDYLRGDILTVRYTGSSATTAASLEDKRPYFRSSLAAAKIFAGEDEASDQNRIDDGSARIFELVAHTYYVGPSGRTCQGVSVPSLFRKSISSQGKPTSEELVPGVEHLQFKYQVGNQYVDANDIADWSTVTAVETTVLVRTECPEGSFVNEYSFSMGDLASAYGPSDNHRRQLFTSFTSLRN